MSDEKHIIRRQTPGEPDWRLFYAKQEQVNAQKNVGTITPLRFGEIKMIKTVELYIKLFHCVSTKAREA